MPQIVVLRCNWTYNIHFFKCSTRSMVWQVDFNSCRLYCWPNSPHNLVYLIIFKCLIFNNCQEGTKMFKQLIALYAVTENCINNIGMFFIKRKGQGNFLMIIILYLMLNYHITKRQKQKNKEQFIFIQNEFLCLIFIFNFITMSFNIDSMFLCG